MILVETWSHKPNTPIVHLSIRDYDTASKYVNEKYNELGMMGRKPRRNHDHDSALITLADGITISFAMGCERD